MTVTASITGHLTLGHVFGAAGLDPSQVVVLRHTYTADGLATPADVTPANLLAYVRVQGVSNKLGKTPPFHWLNFMTDGGRRSRFLTAYENHGELPSERTTDHRFFDLRPSHVLTSLQDRLVVEWSRDAVNWAKAGNAASAFPVVEIADPVEVPFPGFDKLLISYEELVAIVQDRRYAQWRSALSAVQGVYLIADTTTGQLYVGKADGGERIMGRWTSYARDGHGSNVALRQLANLDPRHARHFKFSILQVFGPAATTREIDEAESHYKEALLTRRWGMNRN
ncbi:GIY-YIG nuclease family protein [Nakamurella sp.]|uniref:GIY-YIG nuclease family protein n=1 Tax=Nakamurella sp. TaxID=1869182 RepID=UPI003B3AE550